MRVTPPAYTYERGPSLVLQERIVAALLAAAGDGRGPIDAPTVAVAVHTSERNARRYLNHMRAQGSKRRVRIGGWRRGERSGMATALYTAGVKEDTPRPPKYTPSQLNKRYRNNNPDKVVDVQLAKRAQWLRPRRDEMTTALFGAAS